MSRATVTCDEKAPRPASRGVCPSLFARQIGEDRGRLHQLPDRAAVKLRHLLCHGVAEGLSALFQGAEVLGTHPETCRGELQGDAAILTNPRKRLHAPPPTSH